MNRDKRETKKLDWDAGEETRLTDEEQGGTESEIVEPSPAAPVGREYAPEEEDDAEGAIGHAPSSLSGEEDEEGDEDEGESGPSARQRERRRKRRRRRRNLIKFCLLIVLLIAVYLFLHSPVFTIEKITVSESSHFKAEEILKTAGIKKGMNLFDFRASKGEKALEENPYIAAAKISRKLPSDVTVKLDERQELAVVQKGKQYITIDSDGVVLQIGEELPHYTLLSGITATTATAGETITVKETRDFENLMDFVRIAQSSDLFFKRLEYKGIMVKAYVTEKLYCSGKYSNLVTGMKEGNLWAVLYDLYQKKIRKGVVKVGDDQYYSFNKKTK